MKRLNYLLSHWKLGVHHALKTRRFGVDNQWRSPFKSIWGLSFFPFLAQFILIYPIIRNIRAMNIRISPSTAFIPEKEYNTLFPKETDQKIKPLK